MNVQPESLRLARTSLTLGILGWLLYLLQWCFDLTLGLLLAALTAGSSAVCSTVLDILPFGCWLAGILTGHVALRQIKHSGSSGNRPAIWGLILSYLGMFFTLLLIGAIVALISIGIGAGGLDKYIPFLPKR